MRELDRHTDVPLRAAGVNDVVASWKGLPTTSQLLALPTVSDARGDLTFIEGGTHIPFAVRRVYYFYGMQAGDRRGCLAHLKTDLCLMAVAGRVHVRLEREHGRFDTVLDRPNQGLLIPHLTWLEMDDFSPGTVCLVLSSELYDDADYVRDHDEFLRVAAAD